METPPLTEEQKKKLNFKAWLEELQRDLLWHFLREAGSDITGKQIADQLPADLYFEQE